MNITAVFSDGQEWFFWDETWTMFLGPYPSQEEAEDGCKEYQVYLDSGLYPNSLQEKEWRDGEEMRSYTNEQSKQS